MSGAAAASFPLFQSRRAGVLLHVTSLDGGHGIGDLGPAAHAFLEWLARSGSTIWQMLPLGPVGEGNSPYSARSSFACEPLLVSAELLAEDGLLTRREARPDGPRASSARRVEWEEVRRRKGRLFSLAYERFLAAGGAGRPQWHRFLRNPWLRGWCAMAADEGGSPGLAAFLQFQFERQWMRLRSRARRLGVRLLGDLPIFVPLDSQDVRDQPRLFRLDARGRPEVVTGVPPDCFSRDGQRWNHPHYRWREHRRDGFRWWIRRVQRVLELVDAVRVDHFVGFVNAYEIPGAAATARRGRWRATPGAELLAAIARAVGPLPFVAEDLGAVTPRVTALREAWGLPGMRLVQNAFGGGDSWDLPHRHPAACVAYPGTHDNDTTAGWWRTLPAPARRRLLDYAGGPARSAVESMIRITMTSPANTAIIPMQDHLRLGSRARMNVPGKAEGNWTWRLPAGWHGSADARAVRRVIEAAGRLQENH